LDTRTLIDLTLIAFAAGGAAARFATKRDLNGYAGRAKQERENDQARMGRLEDAIRSTVADDEKKQQRVIDLLR